MKNRGPRQLSFGWLPLCALLASSAAAQPTLFYADFRELGRVDSAPVVGPLTPSVSVDAVPGSGGLARLPDGTLLELRGAIRRVNPDTLEATEIAPLGFGCFDATADGDGNLWCVGNSTVQRYAADSYAFDFATDSPGLDFRGIATLGPRLFAIANLREDVAAGPHLVEIDPVDGGASVLHPIRLPPSPDGLRFFGVSGMDFDDNGDLWLGLPLFLPAVTLPPPPEGHVVRVLDPLAGAVVQAPQRLGDTLSPTPVVIGAPTVVAVPAVGISGLATLVGLLLLSALAMLSRSPDAPSPRP
ncbi:MAG: hypothetical protein AAGM22_29250 [Acidobacteriota bacterium]